MPDLLHGRVLILGGGHGIGRALAEALFAVGAEVHVLDRDKDRLNGVAEAGARIHAHQIDMTDRAAVRAYCDAEAAAGGRFNAVVIAAAIHGGCPAAAMSDEFIATLLDVNLGAHMGFVRDILPLMADEALLVGISSNCAEIGIPMESVYAATKAGLERYYEALVIELADRRIRPMVVQVGNVNTGFNETGNAYAPAGDGFTDRAYRTVIGKIDSRNGLPPEKVALAIRRQMLKPRPPFRVIVGTNALKTYWARRLAGTEMSLKMLSKVFGLKGV
jgi:NAD(P)-dependent dehydrogenase (short-subunit alcohol dehydrogenase family)